MMESKVRGLQEEFKAVIIESQNIAIYTRDILLQKKQKFVLLRFIDQVENFKEQHEPELSEVDYHLTLRFIISCRAVMSELSMLINLKEGSMAAARENLATARTHVATIHKYHKAGGASCLDGYQERLEAYEKLIFPIMEIVEEGAAGEDAFHNGYTEISKDVHLADLEEAPTMPSNLFKSLLH